MPELRGEKGHFDKGPYRPPLVPAYTSLAILILPPSTATFAEAKGDYSPRASARVITSSSLRSSLRNAKIENPVGVSLGSSCPSPF